MPHEAGTKFSHLTQELSPSSLNPCPASGLPHRQPFPWKHMSKPSVSIHLCFLPSVSLLTPLPFSALTPLPRSGKSSGASLSAPLAPTPFPRGSWSASLWVAPLQMDSSGWACLTSFSAKSLFLGQSASPSPVLYPGTLRPSVEVESLKGPDKEKR